MHPYPIHLIVCVIIFACIELHLMGMHMYMWHLLCVGWICHYHVPTRYGSSGDRVWHGRHVYWCVTLWWRLWACVWEHHRWCNHTSTPGTSVSSLRGRALMQINYLKFRLSCTLLNWYLYGIPEFKNNLENLIMRIHNTFRYKTLQLLYRMYLKNLTC